MKDNLAMVCSSLCLLHCVAVPLLLIAGISGVALSWLEEEWLHQTLLIPVVLLALLSLPQAYKSHRSAGPIVLAAVGISAMLSSFYLPETLELWLVIPSALLIISAHGMNKVLLKSSY